MRTHHLNILSALACALLVALPAAGLLADTPVTPAARLVKPGGDAADATAGKPAAEAPKSQADRDFQAFQDASDARPPKSFNEMSRREQEMFFEDYAMNMRDRALVFLAAHPQDPRRWSVAMRLGPQSPRFVLQWGEDGENGRPQATVDEAAAAAWKARVEQLQADMKTAQDLPEDVRKMQTAMAEREVAQKAFAERWQSDKQEMAPDFVTYDLDGREVKVSDYRGKTVILDFWASWCGPCKAAFPHVQQLAANYADQGVVVLGSGTSDKREDFEKYVRENQDKYPDIVWTHDKAERGDDRASKALYGVMGIPTQFVIDPQGRVVEVVVGYSQGDVRLDVALAKAGVEVDPEVLAKAEADAKKRGS
jgi:thiol-disulfide isomerase/thioredoxin